MTSGSNLEKGKGSKIVSDVGEMTDVLYEEEVRVEFQKHLPDAVKTIVEIATTGKSESVRRLAANDIIEHGHHRKGSDPLGGLLDDGKLQIQVNLIQFEQSEHGLEVSRRKAVEMKEINPAVMLEDDDVIELDPELDLVITNPGDKVES